MKQKTILLFAILLPAISIFAQKYNTAAGIRIGSGIGISVQQRLWDNYTMEGIVQKNLFKDGTHVAALFEQHNKLLSKGLNFYIGAGPHFSFYNQEIDKEKSTTQTTPVSNAFGISAIGGIEMRLKNVVLSYDFQPGVNFHGGTNVFSTQTGLSARYILIKSKKANKKGKGDFWKKFKKVPEEGDE